MPTMSIHPQRLIIVTLTSMLFFCIGECNVCLQICFINDMLLLCKLLLFIRFIFTDKYTKLFISDKIYRIFNVDVQPKCSFITSFTLIMDFRRLSKFNILVHLNIYFFIFLKIRFVKNNI